MTRFSSRLLFQFTPLREGRRYVGRVFQRIPISIHAPPRGATGYPARTAQAMIFQFTPLREGRRRFGKAGMRQVQFQFTPLREGRRGMKSRCYSQNISIHAPPRGATCKQYFQWLNERFQFTPLREGRRRDRCSARADGIFQFTPLREGRRRDDSAHRTPVIFQFTPLREGRRVPTLTTSSARISIHAPPRGATGD